MVHQARMLERERQKLRVAIEKECETIRFRDVVEMETRLLWKLIRARTSASKSEITTGLEHPKSCVLHKGDDQKCGQ